MQTRADLAFCVMASRPVVVGAWGRHLAALRQRRSLSTVLRKLRQMGINNISRSTLYQYEKGQVSAPDPVVLLGLAQIYGVDVAILIEALAVNRRQPDLEELPPPQPGAVVLEPDERALLDRLRTLPPEERKLYLEFIAYRHARGVQKGLQKEEVPSQPTRAASRPRGRR